MQQVPLDQEMSWLRIDDRFANHPKIARLSDKEFRIWMRTLCYCAAYQDPTVDAAAIREVVGLTPAMVIKFHDFGLLDPMGADHEIHDWASYQPTDKTGADRQAKWRARNMNNGFDTRSGKWQATRAAVFDRDQGICMDCGKDCKTPVDERDRWNADHEPHRDDLKAAGLDIYDIAYIVTRCHSCHAKKTRAEAKQRRDRQLQVRDAVTAAVTTNGH